MDKSAGGRPSKTGPTTGRVSGSYTLAEIGITRNESHRWQQLAGLAMEHFEEYVSECHARARELTTVGALARARRLRSEQSPTLERPSSRENQLVKYEKTKRAWLDLIWLDPTAVVSAMEPSRRPRESEDVGRLMDWLEGFRTMLEDWETPSR
jgi:hypothetical protein